MMNKEFKLKLKKWAFRDYEDQMRMDGCVEIYNSYGGVEGVITKKEYFDGVKKVNSYKDLEDWWMGLGGENAMGIGDLIDSIEEEKID